MDSSPAPTTHPLRPYAVAPAPDSNWSFASTSQPSKASAGSNATFSPPISTSNRYASSSIADLDINTSPTPPGVMLRAFTTSCLLSFTGTALVMPFEVGKTLAQVQWVPKDGFDAIEFMTDDTILPEEATALEDEAEAEAYFSDLANASAPGFAPPSSAGDLAPRSVSPSGYLKRSGVADETLGTKPEWIMPVVVQGGVWEMIKAVGRWKGEGWASLWKGQLTSCVLDAFVAFTQPFLLTSLSFTFLSPSSLPALPLIYSPRPAPLLLFSTISHTLASLLVSPLDLVRTRLIVQSSQPAHKKYKGPYHALETILNEEGGIWNTYFHPNLLIPTLLEGFLRPAISLSTPLIISRYLHIEASSSPITFGLAELVLGTAGLLVTIPIETVRKRLQIQSRADFVRAGRAGGTGRAWRTCVETRPAAYAGVVEAVYRILTEETGRIPRRRRRRSAASPAVEKESFMKPAKEEKEDLGGIGLGAGSGLTQLYRGFGMGCAANIVVFLLGLVAGTSESAGWAEV